MSLLEKTNATHMIGSILTHAAERVFGAADPAAHAEQIAQRDFGRIALTRHREPRQAPDDWIVPIHAAIGDELRYRGGGEALGDRTNTEQRALIDRLPAAQIA